jgi:hypothetical protein
LYIAACDPGKRGAFCFLDPEKHTLKLHEMPTHVIKPGEKSKEVIDPYGVAHILDTKEQEISQLFLEEVNAMPGQGVVSMFSLGQAYGIVRGVAGGLKIPLTLIRPAVWKKDLKVPADKDAARYRASQLFPECASEWKHKHQDGLAEASLIALWGMSKMGFQVKQKFRLE